MNSFNYILKKIEDAEFIEIPFKFLYIEDFLNQSDFDELVSSHVMNTKGESFYKLNNELVENGWEPHLHPGTFKSLSKYLDWREYNFYNSNNLKKKKLEDDLCEGRGLAYRLNSKLSRKMAELRNLFLGEDFRNLALRKFNLNSESDDMNIDCGFQKYVHGYEISPHPDIREKALTWMLNLNTVDNPETDYHTHFQVFKDNRKYIYDLWKYFPHIQRSWVPWDWCETIFKQKKNNSITLFSPDSYTLHAIKASYNDLNNQRTQLYGNIWYEKIFDSNFQSKFINSSFKDYDYLERFSKTKTKKVKSLVKLKNLFNIYDKKS